MSTPQKLTAPQQLEMVSSSDFNSSTGGRHNSIRRRCSIITILSSLATCATTMGTGLIAIDLCGNMIYNLGRLIFIDNVSTPPVSVTPPTTLDPNNAYMNSVAIHDELAGGYVINGSDELQAPPLLPPTSQETIDQLGAYGWYTGSHRRWKMSSLSSDGASQVTVQNHVQVIIPAPRPSSHIDHNFRPFHWRHADGHTHGLSAAHNLRDAAVLHQPILG